MSQATALLADAESSIASGAWDQALQQLESIKQSEPQEPDVYRRLAHVLAVRGRYRSVVQTYVDLIGVLLEVDQLSEAEGVIGTVLALQPECEEAREKRIEIEKRRGNTDRAVYLARELARLCIEQGEGDRSIRLLQDAQKAQPENLDISLELAEMFVSHGQIQDGANQYRKVANAFQETGNISKAAEAYRRMKVVQSDDPEVLLTLGRLYTELGKLDEAEQEFRSVLRHDLEHQDALLELGLVCQLKGRFRSGLLAFNKVLQNNPKLPRAMRKLGELNLSMGKQDEAVQHFLEAAQAYLEAEERDQAIEIFQIVLGVDEGNAQAQQGLTNLGAPLEPKEFEPPLPPTPPEEEPPTPEASPVSPVESIPPPRPESKPTESKTVASTKKRPPGSGLTRPASGPGSGSKGRRKGLVSGGLLRKGLVDPSAGGGKPMLGGKPTLGGGGSTRAGLRRPGLGMKGGPGGNDKPMLGLNRGMGMGSKPTLGRRPPPQPEPELEHEEAPEEDDAFSSLEKADEGAAESLFGDSDDDGGVSLEDDFGAAASELFDGDSESPFGEGLGDSLFAPDEGETQGRVSARSESESAAFPEVDSAAAESGDDLFDMSGGEDLFGDDEASAGGGLFDDDALPTGDIFAEESGGGLFDDAPAPTAAPQPSQDAAAEDDLFGGEQFENLFDESDADEVSASDTIGSMKSEPAAEEDIFSASDQPAFSGESDFDNLFGEEPAEAAQAPVDDLFATQVEGEAGGLEPEPAQGGGLEPEPAQGGALFEQTDEGSDLFGNDLFATEEKVEESQSGGDDLFGGGALFDEPEPAEVEAEAPTMLFDEPEEEEAEGISDSLFEAGPANGQAQGGLFEEAGGDDDDLFGGGDALFDEPAEQAEKVQPEEEEFDLFSEPAQEAAAPTPQEEPVAAEGGLFDGFDSEEEPSGDDLFGAEPAAGLFDEPASEEGLFGEEPSGDDLFGGPEPAGAMGETALDLADDQAGGGLFDELEADQQSSEMEQDLFDIPDPTEEPTSLFDEPEDEAPESAASLFDLPVEEEEESDSAGNLFDSLPDEPEPQPAAPLNLDLPMPGDPPVEVESVEEYDADDFGGDLFEGMNGEEAAPDEDALTIDMLRAEEMARSADVPEAEPSDSPEFMRLLELTLPKAEEEADEEAVADEESVPSAEPELVEPEPADSLFDEATEMAEEGGGGGGLFDEPQEELFDLEPEPEPEPVDEGPEILGKPKVSLSIEDESPTVDIERADQLDASLAGADVAAKIAAYRKTLEDVPDNLVMRTRLADIHLKYGMLEDALVQYRQVMRRNTESISLLHRVIQAEFWTENYPEAGESLLSLAKLHLKRGEHHDALDTLQSVLSLDSHHFEARKVLVSVFTSLGEDKLAAHHLRQLAETALTKGDLQEAISAFQQLLEISDDPVFEERLAQIYESQGDMERALKSFQSLVGRYQAEERWEEAARVTERIVELNPGLLEDRGALVELYKKLGMNEKAMEQQFKLARLYQEKGELAPAVRLYEDVLGHQPENQDARRSLVDAYLDSGAVPSALEQAEALTEYYLNTKDHQTAIELYTRLVEADPENVELQERLVKFYGLAGDPENAKMRWIGLADLHEQKERYSKAAEAIQKALELDEGQVELQHRLALLFADRLDDKVAALTQLRKLFQIAPERLDAVRMYIDILLKEEQVAEAGQVLQQLEQAGGESVVIKNNVINELKSKVEANPTDLKARFNYGELCYHLGDLDHAIEQFQQTRRNPEYELMSYNMLGLCFAKKRGFNMLDLAIKQFKKGLETRGHSEQSYLELRYNLALIQYQNGRVSEALADFKECYRVDITYRDVRSWIEKIETELASSGS